MSDTRLEASVLSLLTDFVEDVDFASLSSGTRLGEDLGMDSLTHIEFLTLLEREFHVAIPDAEVGELWTVGAITRRLESLRA